MRIMQQINISTSLSLVRFLSAGLNSTLSALDMCVASILVLLLSYVFGYSHIISTLSRRLAILLILEEIRPLIVSAASGETIVHIRGLMINTGVVSILAVLPQSFKETNEAQTLISSIMYMYSDIFLFLTVWGDIHITLVVVCCVLSYLINSDTQQSLIFSSTLDIISTGITSLVFTIALAHVERQRDVAVVQLLLMFTVAHCASVPVIHRIEDYMLYRIASILQKFIVGDHWLWCGFFLLLTRILTSWIGLGSWATRVTILVLVNVVVASLILYIQTLAVYDTIVTLKASALIIQFLLHEFSVLTFTPAAAQTTQSSR